VRLGKRKGIVRARPYDASIVLPQSFDIKNADNEIIGVALGEQTETPRRKVILVSRDINMRVKCDALGILCEGYVDNQVVDDLGDIYTGFVNQLVDDQIIDQFYNNEEVILEEEGTQLYDN
jgi:PhoH-like ATPase